MPSPTSHRPPPPRLATPTNDLTNLAWSPQKLQPADPNSSRSRGTGATGISTSGTTRVKKRRPWRKLLWVKQDCGFPSSSPPPSSPLSAPSPLTNGGPPDPDNWVDPTFLSQLQRNINVHPYDFYSLVADSTVIVQHLSSVMIFVTSFIAMVKERVSPVHVASVSTALTVAGWAIWDMGWEKREKATTESIRDRPHSHHHRYHHRHNRSSAGAVSPGAGIGLGFEIDEGVGTHSRTPDEAAAAAGAGAMGYFPLYNANGAGGGSSGSASTPASPVKGRLADDERVLESVDDMEFVKKDQRSRRLKTAKSTLLIYFTLLGLSPILRSLTGSITSDSIWAIATWLFLANCLSFDYGSGVEVKFPASLSTNAAITSSVVLASRLPPPRDGLPPATAHVFSLILISIQVFGLFPVFRRYLKHVSWGLHVALTAVLVLGAAGGLGAVVGWGWAVVWVLGVVGGMGGCGWWLISLQKYKNEIHGPWDPARPVIRRQWE